MTTRGHTHAAAAALACGLLAPLLLIPARAARAQEPVNAPVRADEHSATDDDDDGDEAWSVYAAVNIYIVPDSRTYAQPTLAADRDWLHLEGRYNYEDLDTASTWVGYNLDTGDTVSLELTPMAGGVFGQTTGFALGFEITIDWWKFELYSEGEYFVDATDSDNNFFYSWAQLSLSPWDWLDLGVVEQQTQAYNTDVDVQRGILIGFSYRWFSLTTFVFNLDQSQQTVVLGLEAEF